ncbi:MAG: hypothetical protein EOP86_27285 [Verrucomicrobiaceae bacterium]|nr:MAG: hypothetical protein EOP86_27285 [Verrucomicrobiaceae bacterium]
MSTTADATLETASFSHRIWSKPIFSRTDVLSVLPGGGSGILRQFLAARWFTPSVLGKRPFFRSADVRTALERLGKGELPMVVHVWRTGHSLDGKAVAHLVPAAGAAQPLCSFKGELFASLPAQIKCTVCLGKSKTLRVEET